MRIRYTSTLFSFVTLLAVSTATVFAQDSATTRAGAIEQAQLAKIKTLHPYVPSKAEQFVNRFDGLLSGGGLTWHPFLNNAYSGGGFALGLGYARHVGAYSSIDFRGSYSIKGYKRAEVEFNAPRLFQRRGHLTLLGGWREATQVGYYGLGTGTSKDDRLNYLFAQPHASALFTLWPARRLLMLRGGVELSRWSLEPGRGLFPPLETVYTPATLPGLGTETTYVHAQGTVGFDWRTAPDYSRRGGYYGVTLHDYADRNDEFGFQQVDYEVIQHVPILRETWVLSFRGLARTTSNKSGQHVPFFMLPSVGGGSSLRGYSSWRFRDRNSLLVQAEWRIMANRFFESAFFYDAGKVAARRADLDFDGLKSNYGFGLRFHGPVSTPLRVEAAKSREGLALIFSSGAAF